MAGDIVLQCRFAVLVGLVEGGNMVNGKNMNHKHYMVFQSRLKKTFDWDGFSREADSKKRFFEAHTLKYLPNELKNYIYMAHECSFWIGKLNVDAILGTEERGRRISIWLEMAMQPKKNSEYTQWLNLEMNLMDLEPLLIDNL